MLQFLYRFIVKVFRFLGHLVMAIVTGRMPNFKKGGKEFLIFSIAVIIIFMVYVNIISNNFASKNQTSSNKITTEETKKETSSSTNSNKDAYLVTRVIDGDTFEVASGQKVRMIGIDTPEISGDNTPECYGSEAAIEVKSLLENQEVFLQKDVSETDKYGRLLRYVYLDELFINEYLVNTGYAYAADYPPDSKYKNTFAVAEQSAKNAQRGLWSQCADENQIQGTTDTAPTGCDIKGNISWTGDKIYHLHTCQYYSQTEIDTSAGEKYFCTEQEALDAGWRKASNCP